MTALRSRNRSFKIVATIAMVLFMTLASACEILATDGARDAIANGREIRQFEDETLLPIEAELNDLWANEIEPRERELEDLRRELQVLEEDLLQPLWDAQNDMWAPGGAASVVQAEFDERYRELDIAGRQIEVEQRDLDARWQALWGANGVDPEFQELEDARFEKQRELDRLYRFGNRPVNELWDQINELNAQQNWGNTDSQIESERINIELRRLYDLQTKLQNSSGELVNELYNKANNIQNQLNDLYNTGWDPINELNAEADRLEREQNSTGTSGDADAITQKIIELKSIRDTYRLSRDAELAAWKESLAAAEAAADGTSVDAVPVSNDSTDGATRIVELQALIAELEAEAAELRQAKNAEVDLLSQQITDKRDLYDQLIADAEADFLVLSTSLLADASALNDQIDGLNQIGDADAITQIAVLQPQYDALIAQEQTAEDDLHTQVAGFESERDTGVDELKAEKDALEALILHGLTDSIDAQIAEYNVELGSLQVDTTSQTVADIRASIEASEAHWGSLIDDVTNQILALENELFISSADTASNERIQNLRLQAQELEKSLVTQISKLEALVKELYRQAETGNSGDSDQLVEIQKQIDIQNQKLEEIWQRDSTAGIEILLQVRELERQARVAQDELADQTYRLEEELWDLDDKLSLFYKDQNSEYQKKEAAFQAESAALQLRRTELEELRWAIDEDQRASMGEIELEQKVANDRIRKIEQEQFGTIKDKIRAIEDELRVFYNQRRDLERTLNEAQVQIDQKKRELEDKVFDALESAAGTVDEAGDTVLTATEEAIPEGPESIVPADGTAN